MQILRFSKNPIILLGHSFAYLRITDKGQHFELAAFKP